MAELISKYNVGDIVWNPWVIQTQKQAPCPDCLGTKTWQLLSPGGIGYLVACPRCQTRHLSNRELSLLYNFYEPNVQCLTIGSIQYDSNSREESSFSYMCRETGVGSGSVYRESALCETKEQALVQAQVLADNRNSEQKKHGGYYHGRPELHDYQILPAMVHSLEADVREASRKFENLGNDIADKIVGEYETTADILGFVVKWFRNHKFRFEDFDPSFDKYLEKLMKKED